jgi:hypothetical protein
MRKCAGNAFQQHGIPIRNEDSHHPTDYAAIAAHPIDPILHSIADTV